MGRLIQCKSVSPLKKQIFYREDAKRAKKINNARRKRKSFCERLKILNFIFNNLGVLRAFAVRKPFCSAVISEIRGKDLKDLALYIRDVFGAGNALFHGGLCHGTRHFVMHFFIERIGHQLASRRHAYQHFHGGDQHLVGDAR